MIYNICNGLMCNRRLVVDTNKANLLLKFIYKTHLALQLLTYYVNRKYLQKLFKFQA